ncbi:MAG: nicotinate-nicotinamide nucleotide adenylyltransferase [Myxococcaceae bacterium]|nr:nicotinate-nicotinamide nucleotide adenylyltransferase [Myxococcaceae bacterium]
MKVALLGGSFNPPHVGHLMAALYARTALGFDEVWLVPSFHHPFHKPLAPFADRVALCGAMTADVGPWLKVCEAERDVGGEGRTIELLEYLLPRNAGTRFSLVIGSDIVRDLPSWKAFDRIEQLVDVVVLQRAGFPEARAVGPALAQVSSTELRERLARRDRPELLVPRAVLALIDARGLYR